MIAAHAPLWHLKMVVQRLGQRQPSRYARAMLIADGRRDGWGNDRGDQ
jgi:hypothetical protein